MLKTWFEDWILTPQEEAEVSNSIKELSKDDIL